MRISELNVRLLSRRENKWTSHVSSNLIISESFTVYVRDSLNSSSQSLRCSSWAGQWASVAPCVSLVCIQSEAFHRKGWGLLTEPNLHIKSKKITAFWKLGCTLPPFKCEKVVNGCRALLLDSLSLLFGCWRARGHDEKKPIQFSAASTEQTS